MECFPTPRSTRGGPITTAPTPSSSPRTTRCRWPTGTTSWACSPTAPRPRTRSRTAWRQMPSRCSPTCRCLRSWWTGAITSTTPRGWTAVPMPSPSPSPCCRATQICTSLSRSLSRRPTRRRTPGRRAARPSAKRSIAATPSSTETQSPSAKATPTSAPVPLRGERAWCTSASTEHNSRALLPSSPPPMPAPTRLSCCSTRSPSTIPSRRRVTTPTSTLKCPPAPSALASP
mmetsp:Transcript_59785/g.143614  ORF Transcript_59785/g.143614 Transcript_59785/m.143614 type:complete len:231 (-) Transcript_59785:681-1373(-)